jgi:hypothetical protein
MSAIKHHMPGNKPKDYTQHSGHGKGLKLYVLVDRQLNWLEWNFIPTRPFWSSKAGQVDKHQTLG